MHWLGTWLFPRDDAEIIFRRFEALVSYMIRVD
jgi:hypothetical protein